jgi:hypothetical protein
MHHNYQLVSQYKTMRTTSYLLLLSTLVFVQPAKAGNQAPHIPEPLMFDLVRPLGPKKGEIEFNILTKTPLSKSNNLKSNDPFSTSPSSKDKGSFEWAPEIEYAVSDEFAVEFELPFEGSTLEQYKLGLQWTLGTLANNSYIHGIQALVQPNTDWQEWNSTLLYLGGYKFNDSFSGLFMAGGRMNLEGANKEESFEKLFNFSVFYTQDESVTLGLEHIFSYKNSNENSARIIPQIHWELTKNISIQTGVGFGYASDAKEISFIARPVLTF